MRLWRMSKLCLGTLALLALASVCGAQPAAPAPAAPAARVAAGPARSVEVKVEAQSDHQTIAGFGTMWVEWGDRPEYHDPKFFDLAVNDLGMSILRIFSPDTEEVANDDNDPNHFNWPGFNCFELNKRMVFAQEFKKRGVQRFLLTIISPTAFLKTNRAPDWGGALRADMHEEYAEQVAAMIEMAQHNWGINITDVTIQNELLFMEFYGSCVYHPEGVREAVRALMHKFQKEGIKSKIFMPEDMMDFQRMSAYIKPTMADPETSKFDGGFCTHRLGKYDVVQRWYDLTKQYGRENWMTETGGHRQDWNGAMTMAGDMYDYLVGGNFNAWIYERLSENANAVSGLFIGGTPGPKYYAAKHYFRYVRPGAVRVEAQSADQDLLVSAYRHDVDGTLTVVLINRADQPATVRLAASGKGLPANYTVYRSTETDKCIEAGQAEAGKDLAMPAKSIVTLYGKSDALKTRAALDPVPIAWNDPKPATGESDRWGDFKEIQTPPIFMDAGRGGNADAVRQKVAAGTSVNVTDASGWTPLFMAILCGNEANGKPGTVVQTLLELGANVNQAATDGWTPLHMAAASFHNNKYPVFRLIMDAKPDVNAKTKDGLTPLHVAAMSALVAYQQKPDDSVNRVLDLIKAGADIEATDDNGRTPLIWAAMQGAQSGVAVSDFMVKALLDAKAKVDARDNIGRMALHYAAEQGYDSIVAALLQAGAKTDVKDNDGKSPADLAAARELASTLQVLKAPPAAAPAAAPGIATPATPAKALGVLGAELVRATRAGNVDEVKSLLARGADVTFRDSDGFSAMDRARDLGNAEILKMLQDAEKKQPAPAAAK